MENQIMRFFWLAIIMSVMWACGDNKPATDPNAAIMRGEINNAVEDLVLLTYLEGSTSETDTAWLDEHNRFRTKLSINEPKYILFQHGNEYQTFFLSPGDSIDFSLNTAHFDESLKFYGQGAAANNYLISSFLFAEQKGYDTDIIYKLPPAAFMAEVDSVRMNKERFLNEYIKGRQELNPKFIESEKARIQYQWANQRLSYPKAYTYYTDRDPVLPEGYDDYLEDLQIDNPEMIHLNTYAIFLSRYVDKLVSDQMENDSTLRGKENAWALSRFNAIRSNFKNKVVQDYLYFRTIKDQIKYHGINDLDPLITTFRERVHNEEYIEGVNKLREKWSALEKGNRAPGFTYSNIHGEAYSLSDFSGKYVYIDVWASWCEPCKKELPYLEKLIEKYEGADIVFIGISIDGLKEKWEGMVREKNLKGIQLYSGGPRASITDDYLIYRIPRFILIDKEGKIFNAQAPRPSGDIEETLAGLEL